MAASLARPHITPCSLFSAVAAWLAALVVATAVWSLHKAWRQLRLALPSQPHEAGADGASQAGPGSEALQLGPSKQQGPGSAALGYGPSCNALQQGPRSALLQYGPGSSSLQQGPGSAALQRGPGPVPLQNVGPASQAPHA